jgi:DNA-binding transcriptional MerR regulator
MTSDSLSADVSVPPPGVEGDYCSIGDMARQFNVTLRALRFYEDRGLIRPMRVGALRLYDGAARERLRIILKGKLLGFTLTEIRELLAASGSRSEDEDLRLAPNQIATQLSTLEQRRAQLDAAIAELRSAAERLGAAGAEDVAGGLAA